MALHHNLSLSVAAALLLSGCVTDGREPYVPPMPRVTGSAGPAAPMLSTAERVAQARAELAGSQAESAAGRVAQIPWLDRTAAVRDLIEPIARHDAALAARFAVALPVGGSRDTALAIVGQALGDAGVSPVMAWSRQASGIARAHVLPWIARRWLERDTARVMAEIQDLPESPERDQLLGVAAAAWAERDPNAALAWVRRLPDGPLQQDLTLRIAFAIAQTEPRMALEVAMRMPEGRERLLLLATIGRTWIARDRDAAWTWAQGLPPGETRDAALAGIETGLGISAIHDRGLATDIGPVAGTVGIGLAGRRDGRVTTLARHEVAVRREFDERLLESPLRAADYLTALPAPDRKDEMVQRLTREWLAINPTAAEAWMEQNIISPGFRDQLLREAGRR